MVFTAFMSAVSQVMLNISAAKEYPNRIKEYLNPLVIGSYSIYGIVLLINVYCMRYIPMKDASAVATSTYVFSLILSKLILKERISLKKIIGNIAIVVGILIFLNF